MVEGRNKNTCSIVGGISKRAGQLKLVIAGYFYTHMQPMVLVYLPTKLDDFVRANVGKYSIHGAYGIWILPPNLPPMRL